MNEIEILVSGLGLYQCHQHSAVVDNGFVDTGFADVDFVVESCFDPDDPPDVVVGMTVIVTAGMSYFC